MKNLPWKKIAIGTGMKCCRVLAFRRCVYRKHQTVHRPLNPHEGKHVLILV